MALGDYSRNTDNNKKTYAQPIVRLDSYGTMNPDGVDPSALNYEFYNGMLKIIITPLKFGSDPNKKFTFDNENRSEMWLTPTKAKIFYDEVMYLLHHRDEINNVGVCTTKGGTLIYSTGKEFGVDTDCLIIKKIGEHGKIESTYVYQFKKNPNNFAVRNFTGEEIVNEGFNKVNYENTEIEQLLAIIKQFAEAMTGAYAYANLYYGRFEYNRIIGKMNAIMDKMGIEKSSEYNRGNNNNSSGATSFFSKNEGTPAPNSIMGSYSSYDNMMDEVMNE